jgi:hypothetical protein
MRWGRAAVVALAIAAAGCAQNQLLYRWGSYESGLYDMYLRPGKGDPGTQIAKLTEDIERARAENKNVPPGVHAHLGYLHYTQGQVERARDEFLIERQLFPESAVFIDGVIARMDKQR